MFTQRYVNKVAFNQMTSRRCRRPSAWSGCFSLMTLIDPCDLPRRDLVVSGVRCNQKREANPMLLSYDSFAAFARDLLEERLIQ